MGTKVLIAEDGAVSRLLLRRLLDDWKYEVIEVEDGTAALKELQAANAPRIAILDWMMPGLNGTEVVQHLRAAQHEMYTYVLLLTAKTEKSDVLSGFDAGADDYLTKPFDAKELRARLRIGERIIDLQERLLRALSASEFRASHDGLTGLYNRSAILRLLQREMDRCSREKTRMGAILVDIDHFKRVNDNYGHAVGDEVLLEIAGRMKSALRSYDFLGRYGGEEFLIVVPGCGRHALEDLAERVRRCIAESSINCGQTKIDATISLGATLADGSTDIVRLLQRADVALYEAKNSGRNNVKLDSSVPVEDQSTLVGDLMLPQFTGLQPPETHIH